MDTELKCQGGKTLQNQSTIYLNFMLDVLLSIYPSLNTVPIAFFIFLCFFIINNKQDISMPQLEFENMYLKFGCL